MRILIESSRLGALALLTAWRDGMPDVRPAVLAHIGALDAAMAEVEAAERGCGQPEGECLDPCHLGILVPRN